MIVRNHIIPHKFQRVRPYDAINTLVLHRIGKSIGRTGEAVATKFLTVEKVGKYTGMKIPYHFVVTPEGFVDQCLELEETGYHAGRWNRRSVGIACIGDFRKGKPTNDQWFSLCDLVNALFVWIGPGCQVKRHDELSGGSVDVEKVCPGKHLDVDTLWLEVFKRAPRDLDMLARERFLRGHGVIL